MTQQLREIAAKLTEAFKNSPGETRAALTAALPQAVTALGQIASDPGYSVRERMDAIRTLLTLQKRVVAEDLKRDTVALARRKAEVAIIERRAEEIKAKVARDVENRRKRAALKQAARDLKMAQRIPDGESRT